MLGIKEASDVWVNPIRSDCGTGSLRPLAFRLDDDDDDPGDIDILDVLRRDEAVGDADFFDDEGGDIVFLAEYNGEQLPDE